MISKTFLSILRLAVLFSLVCSGPAIAASSDWLKVEGAKMRLIAARVDDRLRAGLEIALEPDWKTYWRSPGGSGLPPQVDFSKSRNVASAKLLFPAPTAFSDGSGKSAGYKTPVVFPIDVELLFPDQPATLAASGVLGICADICVPVQFDLSLDERSGSGTSIEIVSALQAARMQLPLQASNNFRVVSAARKGNAIEIAATGPFDDDAVWLFVDGPANWYLEPVSAMATGNNVTFQLPLPDRLEKQPIGSVPVTMTLVARGRSVEQSLAITD